MDSRTTNDEMIAEGWKAQQVNGVDCLVMASDAYTIYISASDRDYFFPEELLDIVEQLGRPHKIHCISSKGTIGSLEY